MVAHPWEERIATLAAAGLERSPRAVQGAIGPAIESADGSKLLFCSNDYLGLAADPRLVAAAAAAAAGCGVGAGASRAVSGNNALHEALERRAAAFVDAPAAVLFPSGYQANVGALPALLDAGDVVFSDALNHASIIDGCRLSRADVRVYAHADAGDLARLLAAAPAAGLKLVVTEAVFSMDGDRAPLAAICRAARSAGADVYVDEAHALGVLGPGGRGLAAEAGVAAEVAVRMGTFGKAIGVAGAFVACGEDPARLLRSRARSLLYTTAAPPLLAAAALAGLDLAEAADDRRAALARNVRSYRERAAAAGVPLAASDTAIQPVPIGGARRTMAVSEALWRRGIFAQGIRPPTVPEGTSRLRITLSSAHTEEQIGRLVAALAAALAAAPAEAP
jgi:8-amino-7-oxononanoate synthase